MNQAPGQTATAVRTGVVTAVRQGLLSFYMTLASRFHGSDEVRLQTRCHIRLVA